jgi:recombinational DNA repair protein RecT
MSLDVEFIAVVIIPVIGLIWAVFTYVVPHYQKVREVKKNEEKKNLGPYTNNIINDAAKYYVRPRCSKNDPTHINMKNSVHHNE